LSPFRRILRHRAVVWVALLVPALASAAPALMHAHPAEARTHEVSPAAGTAARVTSSGPRAVEQTESMLRGIPQSGVTLGDPNAPVELVEFADLQCPYCALANAVLLPPIIDEYVRSGHVKLVFRNLDFLGPDSVRAAQTAAAMGEQNHLWDFVELFFANQGPEGSGYASDAFVRAVASAVPGADVGRAMAERSSPSVTAQLAQADAESHRLGVRGTPAFFVVKPGTQPQRLELSSLQPDTFAHAIS
jgi:protein-disulfide isomerase